MSYTVFKNNNKSITAPNESGEIVLDTSIARQIRIEINHNTYKFYDLAEKKYLTLSNISAINHEKCLFTAIIYPCSSATDPDVDIRLVANEENYPIVYKFVDSCLGSTLSSSHITDYNGKYYSNNICLNDDTSTGTGIMMLSKSITIEFEFPLGVKIRLNLLPIGITLTNSFSLTSDNVEIISLFQHNISIDASHIVNKGASNDKYLYSFSFSLINNRYEQYDKDGLSSKSQALSMIKDLPLNNKYPASGLAYKGAYSSGESTMSITVYTIRNIYAINNSTLYATALLTYKNSGLSAATTVDNTILSITPTNMNTLTFSDDVIAL